MRLQGAIRAALDSIPADQAALAAGAMIENYDRLRSEVRSSIPADKADEFDRLFPEKVPFPVNSPAGRLGREASKFSSARALLGSLAGWLDGFIQESRFWTEIQAHTLTQADQTPGAAETK